MLQELRAARQELAGLNADFARFAASGSRAGNTFGQKFKSAALTGVKELSKGIASGIGSKLGESLVTPARKSAKRFAKEFKSAAAVEVKSGGGLAGIFGKLNLGALGVVGAVGLAALAVREMKSALTLAMEQEKITISLDALSLDGGGGSRIFDSIRQDALRTGTDIAAMSSTIQKLMAQGMDESSALDLNKALLDIAGGTGLTTAEISLLGNALSQVKGKGVAAMEELRGQIAEKGVPIFEALRQRFGADTIGEVFDMISAKKVSAEDVVDTFKNLEGPFARFAGAADRLGQTGGGLFARLNQEAKDLKRVFMEDVLTELKPGLEYAITLIQGMKDKAKEFGAGLARAISYVQAGFEALSLSEMFALAGLALKEKLLEALDFGVRGAAAIIAVLSDGDSFGKMLEMAALRFKSAMMLALKEIMESLEESAGKNSKMGLLFGAAKNQLQVRGVIAADDADALARQGALTPAEMWGKIKKEFAAAPSTFGISESDLYEMERLMQKIEMRRDSNVAARQSAAPIVAPGVPGGGGGTEAAFDPTGMLAGGLANAINRITGGSGDILMKKQIDTQEGTRAAAEKTAAEAARTADAVEKLVTNTNPRRSRTAQAQLVL